MSAITLGFSYLVGAQSTIPAAQLLTKKQESIIPIAAYTAKGELQRLESALNRGLDAGLTVNEIKPMQAFHAVSEVCKHS